MLVYVKQVGQWVGPFWPNGYNLGKGPLDEATYQISKTWPFWIQSRRFLKVFPMLVSVLWPQSNNLNNLARGPLDEATYQISKTWAFWFQTRFLKVFPYKGLCITCDP